jgi:hypothetical protein
MGEIFRLNEIAKTRSAPACICIVREISSNAHLVAPTQTRILPEATTLVGDVAFGTPCAPIIGPSTRPCRCDEG